MLVTVLCAPLQLHLLILNLGAKPSTTCSLDLSGEIATLQG